MHTPDGPGTLHLERRGSTLYGVAWGPGEAWLLAQAPALVGGCDDAASFDPPPGRVREAWRRRRAPLLLGRTDRVFDAALEAVLGQKVQTALAERSQRLLAVAYGEDAPGPVALRLLPTPQRLATLSGSALHRAGLERARADTLIRVAREADRLERAGQLGPDVLEQRLRSLRGVGPWTAAVVRLAALGDADAVLVGDFHVPHAVCWALAGELRGTDARMLELLEPYRPHRGRVVAVLREAFGPAPRFGPRLEHLPVDRYDRPDVRLRDRGPTGRRSAERSARGTRTG